MIVLGLAALLPAGAICYLAFSKKSSPAVKRASIIALGFISAAVVICIAVLYFLSGDSQEAAQGPIPVPPPETNQGLDSSALIVFLLIFIGFFLVMYMVYRREQRKKQLQEE